MDALEELANKAANKASIKLIKVFNLVI